MDDEDLQIAKFQLLYSRCDVLRNYHLEAFSPIFTLFAIKSNHLQGYSFVIHFLLLVYK